MHRSNDAMAQAPVQHLGLAERRDERCEMTLTVLESFQI
jgi:hypothetical protein